MILNDPQHSEASEPIVEAQASEHVGEASAVEPNGIPNDDYSNIVHIFWDAENKRTFFCCDPACTNTVHIQREKDYFDNNNNYDDDNVECENGYAGCTGSGCWKCLGE